MPIKELIKRYRLPTTFVLLFGVVGSVLLLAVHAGTATVSVVASDGIIGRCASSVSDSSASSGQAVKFMACSGGGASALDESGATIPDTAYAVPSGAIFMSTDGSDNNPGTQAAPVKTLNKAINTVPAGGTIVARGGVYRDWYTNGSGSYQIVSKGFTLQPYPHEKVWFDGTDVQAANSWTSDGSGHWYKAWNTPSFCDGKYYQYAYNNQNKDNSGPCSHWDVYGNTAANYPAAGDPQLLFVDGSRMQEVASLSDASGGKFFYDWANKRMYISTNPTGHTVELAARPTAMVLGGNGNAYNLRGIGFRKYATNSYENLTDAAVYIGGNQPAHAENLVFTQNAGSGFSMGTAGSSMVSSVFAFNGYMGAHYYGHAKSQQTDNFQVIGNVFNNNNLEHYDMNCSLSCGAAGFKMSAVLGYTFKGNIFENTVGDATGAWCDTACYNGNFINNLVVNNDTGYHYEQNHDGVVAGNLFVNNNYGINASSDGMRIYNNTLVNSKTIAMRIYDDNRGITTARVALGNNIIAGTSVNSSWLNGRYSTTVESDPVGWFTYYDYNSYWRPTNFTLYRLINATDQYYKSSAEFHAKYTNFEAHATDAVGASDPFFVNMSGSNYKIRTDSAAYHSGGAIPADIAAMLGIPASAGQTRGAVSWPSN